MQRLKTIDLVHTTPQSFHPFVYLDLEDTLLSERSVPNKDGSHFVSVARMNTLKTETYGRKGLFTYSSGLLVHYCGEVKAGKQSIRCIAKSGEKDHALLLMRDLKF